MRYLLMITLALSGAAAWSQATPKLLAPGLLSTSSGEYSPTFDPARGELVFMRRTPGRFDYTLYVSRLGDDGWSMPQVLPFSGDYRDGGPSFSVDGQRLLFDSRRPADDVISLWRVERTSIGWGDPMPIAGTRAASAGEPPAGLDAFGPLETSQGEVLFYSFRRPFRGGAHYASREGDVAVRRADLPDPSASTFVGYLALSPNGHLAVIEGRGPGGNDTDLFYNCLENGKWRAPALLPVVNSLFGEGTPSITSDGKQLFFASDRPTGSTAASTSNLYAIEVQALGLDCAG